MQIQEIKERPEISIIVPVYNSEQYLERCLDSILAQTFTRFEIILVDDGSTDHSGEICNKYAKADPRIHVIHKENGGQSSARNCGLDYVYTNSATSYIGFVDSDDWIHFQMYEVLYSILKKHNASMSICSYKDVSFYSADATNTDCKAQAISSSKKINEEQALEQLFLANNDRFGVVWPKLYARSLFQNRRFDEGVIYEDTRSCFKVLYDAKSIAVTDAELYYYYCNENGTTKAAYTIKRLDIMAAMDEQLNFFRAHNFTDIYSMAVRKYLFLLCYHGELAHKALNDQIIDRMVRSRLEQLFYQERKRCNITPQNCPICYNTLFPRRMKWYWRIQYLKRKLKNDT